MSSVLIAVLPIAKGSSFPSAKMATIAFSPTGVITALGWVKPGHIMLAPERTNLMAPLSTFWAGNKNGY